MRVAALILNWNQAELTVAAAESVREQVDLVVLVDNGSKDSDRVLLRGEAEAHGYEVIETGHNLGYAGGNNVGLRHLVAAGFDAIFVLNSDAVVERGAIALLEARLAADDELAAVMPAVVAIPSRRVLHVECELDASSGRSRWVGGGVPLEEVDVRPRETGYVSGEAFLARTAAFAQCGLFDERFFCYFEDSEWSVRARRAGWRLEVLPTAVVGHHVHGSAGGRTSTYYSARNWPLFLRWALEKPRLACVVRSAPRAFVLAGSLVRRRRFGDAVRGAMAGWIAGSTRVLLGR